MRLSLRQLFAILLFIGLLLMTLRPVIDPDFWWHLRTGQLIIVNHAIPHIDPYSFTMAGSPWVAHEWLSELFMAGLFQVGGYGLLILVFSLIITGSFFFTYLRCPKESRPYIAGFVLLLGAIATAPTWGVRPQMISLLFTSLVLYLLWQYRMKGEIKFLIPLPIITLIWVNMHAGFFLGLGIIALYIAGSLIELLLSSLFEIAKNDAPTLKSIIFLWSFLGASVITTILNPNGFTILIYPFQTLTSQAMQQFIQEWFSPDFHQLMWQPLALFFLALIGLGLIGKKSIHPTQILLTLVFGYAALISARHVPLFVIVAIPTMAEQGGLLLKIKYEPQVKGKFIQVMAPVLVSSLLILVGIRFVQVADGQPKSEAQYFPKAAVDWITMNKPEGNIFNSYGWGGYLIWRLYPEYQVYIDGRADVYGDQFLYSFMDTYRANLGWEETLDERNVRIVLVETGSNLANSLQTSPAWNLAFGDKASVVYIRNTYVKP